MALFPSLPPSKDLTDHCLLGLAVKHQGHLATFAQHLDPTLVSDGSGAYLVTPSA